MGAKDLYLLQVIQYSSSENEPNPSRWGFYIHYMDKSSNLTGDGEIHEVLPIPQTETEIETETESSSSSISNGTSNRTQNAATSAKAWSNRYRYVKRRSSFLTPTFRGACTLALFYKKNLYKVLEGLEYGSNKLNKKGDPNWTPKHWAEERLAILRRDGVVLSITGSNSESISNMMRQAYKSWLAHCKELQEAREMEETAQKEEKAQLHGDPGQVVKSYYSYPFLLYAAV
jgi:hypothetical protein